MLSLDRCQIACLKLVHVSAALYTAEIRSIYQIFCCQINDKLSGLPDHLVRMAFRTHGNRHHRRIGADSSCPCNCNNVGIFLFISRADHNHRQWIQHITGFPDLFAHTSSCVPETFLLRCGTFLKSKSNPIRITRTSPLRTSSILKRPAYNNPKCINKTHARFTTPSRVVRTSQILLLPALAAALFAASLISAKSAETSGIFRLSIR